MAIEISARKRKLKANRVGEGHARRPRAEGQDPHRGRRPRQAAARVAAAPADGRDPQGLGEEGEDDVVEEYARSSPSWMPDAVRTAGRQGARAARAHGATEPGVRVGPQLARLGARPAVERPGPTTTSTSPTRAVLDADHEGLDEVKDRILEFLAVRELRAERGLGEERSGRGSGAILASSGPPAWARPRWANRSRGPGRRSCASRSAACATRPRSVGTGARMSVRGRAASCGRLTEAGDEPGVHDRRDRQGRRRLAR